MTDSSNELGTIILPDQPGTPVGTFTFICNRTDGEIVEIGTPVAADTVEGTVIGNVVDMRTIGRDKNPAAADLRDQIDLPETANPTDVVLAEAQVMHSPKLRPIRSGTVRGATADEVATAVGFKDIDWPIPAGVIPLVDGTSTAVHVDGRFLLGPEAAHLIIGGRSGVAAKTSYAGVLLRSALSRADEDHTVAAIVFNVKGEDLIWLDQEPEEELALTDNDRELYDTMGVPAAPFENVTVYSPRRRRDGNFAFHPRDDVHRLEWDLDDVFDYLHYMYPELNTMEGDRASGFLADFKEYHVRTSTRGKRITTIGQMEHWFETKSGIDDEGSTDQYGWRGHHKSTLRKARRMIRTLPTRSGGLISEHACNDGTDIPDTGWKPGQVIVVDIAGLDARTQGMVVARTVERILRSAEAGTLGVQHVVCLTDELNTFAPAQGQENATVRKILRKTATQGRYAGVTLWGAAQAPSKIDELLVEQAATRALGVTGDRELSDPVHGKIPRGLAERIATLPKGQVALWHHTFRAPLVVSFPRPAWRTGRSRTTGDQQATDGWSREHYEALTEGIPKDTVDSIMNTSRSAEEAEQRLLKARVPDMSKQMLTAPSTFDPDNPYDLS